MKRREVFRTALVGLGGGALSLLGPSKNAEAVLPATGELDVALPPGLVELTSAAGDTLQVRVASTGIARFNYRKLTLLRGGWQIYADPSGTTVVKSLGGTFDLYDSKLRPVGAVIVGSTAATWYYRNPLDDIGTQLRGAGSDAVFPTPMTLWVNVGAPTGPALTIQLVDLDIGEPRTSLDLIALRLSPPPPVKEIIASWSFPAGAQSRTKLVSPFLIPWNATCLAVRCVQTLNVSVYVRLMASQPPGGYPLEIGIDGRPGAPSTAPENGETE